MAKKKRRKKKKKITPVVSAKKDSFQEIKKERKIAWKKRGKFIFYLIPFFAILIAVFLFFYFFTPKNRVKRDPNLNVLLVTIDTIRADRVGYSGYDIETPNLDSLAYGGARFMNAVCQVPLTFPSHTSILTGTNPPFHQIKSNGPYYLPDDFTTLSEILKEKGYKTAAFIGAYSLDSRCGLDQGFDIYDDEYNTPKYMKLADPQRIARNVYQSAEQWIEKNYTYKFFVWVHYYDPHGPYTPPPPFDEKYKSRPYDGEIAYTDVYVGKLIDLLKEKGVYKKTLIIIVGDHGEDLWDHNEPTHGIFLYDTTLKVPLIFHCPDVILKGKKIDKQVRTVDILPTILDILTIDIPQFCQGVSLIPIIAGKNKKETEVSYAETYYPVQTNGWSELKAIRLDKWKYIQAPKPELYNLENAPHEKNNLITKNKEFAQKLKEELEKLEEQLSSHRKPTIRELTLEEQEKLMALGYVSGAIPSESNYVRPDPKDMVHIIKKVAYARQAFRMGDLEKAKKLLEEAKKENPEGKVVLLDLGRIYQQTGEFDKAIEIYKEAIAIDETDVDSYHRLANCYFQAEMTKEAIEISNAALSLHPRHIKSLLLLADVYKSLQNFRKSIYYLERAIEVDPYNQEIRLFHAVVLAISGEYERAIKEYEFLLTKMSQNPMIYRRLGEIYFYKDNFEQAIKYFSEEVKLHPNANSYYLLGAACGKLERYSEAVNYLEKYLICAPKEDISLRKKAEQALSFFKSKLR
ncbi:MAG: sulfatase-like hydrolase/transferase [Candidatus Aminicenantia bacterium]